MDSASLRRKDTTKGPPLRVLCLDGGGVRGYSMLIILQQLMHRIFVDIEGRPPRREEIPKPADYFDLIGGTGTGGLIAIMLGRLRLDLETCMEVYVRMTKKVFEKDKTIAGIPYKQTLFMASKLEEAIKACVKEHTVWEDEGNDGTASGGKDFGTTMSPDGSQISNPANRLSQAEVRRSMSVRSNGSLNSPVAFNRNSNATIGFGPTVWGNPDATLYDGRENRTKTAVTAVYKGTNPRTGSSILLRSYDSRKEPPPEFNCTIWQAGRATSATGLAFKPIQIGQSVFVDEGAGKYNPSPQILEEAIVNEWPGRDMGAFVSIGTGKRPGGTNANQHEWWEGFVGGSMGNFAEARRRLIAKIEDCEDTHIQMVNVELPRRGVPPENYARLNVEVGVGEFGMNEWDRLSEMTINTNRYVAREDTQRILSEVSRKIARIEHTKRRMNRSHPQQQDGTPLPYPPEQQAPVAHAWPDAVELPAEMPPSVSSPQSYHQPQTQYPYRNSSQTASQPGYRIPAQDKYMMLPEDVPANRLSAELPTQMSHDNLRHNQKQPYQQHAPPIPPKTPINDGPPPLRISPSQPPHKFGVAGRPPYPDADGPPPKVNRLRKPEYIPRESS